MEKTGGIWDSLTGENGYDVSYLPFIADVVSGVRDTCIIAVDHVLGTSHSK